MLASGKRLMPGTHSIRSPSRARASDLAHQVTLCRMMTSVDHPLKCDLGTLQGDFISLPPPPLCSPCPLPPPQFLAAGFPLVAEYEWAAADHRHDMGRGDLVCAAPDNTRALVVELKMLHKVGGTWDSGAFSVERDPSPAVLIQHFTSSPLFRVTTTRPAMHATAPAARSRSRH